MEQRARWWGLHLEELGWEIKLEWVPGHVGIEENEEVDMEAKVGVWEDEDQEVGNILLWGEWESRRKKLEGRRWKEFWVGERKGEEYFGSGGGGELGHDGERWFSRMLVWLRTNHGVMSGSRYFEGRGSCICGELETRDHYILYCERNSVLRDQIWKGWDKGVWWDEGWVDMGRLLFEKDGVERLKKFGWESGWKDRKWVGGRWSKKEERSGKLFVPVREEVGGWVGGMSEERRRREAELRKGRKKRYVERLKKGLVGPKRPALSPIASVNSGSGGFGIKGDRIVCTKGVREGGVRKVLGEVDGNRRKGVGVRVGGCD